MRAIFFSGGNLTYLGIPGLIIAAAPPWLLLAFLKIRANRGRASFTEQEEEVAALADQWTSRADAEHAHKLSDIENERQRLMREAQAQHQQRMTEIAAAHAHALAEIAHRYPQG